MNAFLEAEDLSDADDIVDVVDPSADRIDANESEVCSPSDIVDWGGEWTCPGLNPPPPPLPVEPPRE